MRTHVPADKFMTGNLVQARPYGNSACSIAPPIL
jgi:hypothetical protein